MDQVDRQFQTNVFGLIALAKAFIPISGSSQRQVVDSPWRRRLRFWTLSGVAIPVATASCMGSDRLAPGHGNGLVIGI